MSNTAVKGGNTKGDKSAEHPNIAGTFFRAKRGNSRRNLFYGKGVCCTSRTIGRFVLFERSPNQPRLRTPKHLYPAAKKGRHLGGGKPSSNFNKGPQFRIGGGWSNDRVLRRGHSREGGDCRAQVQEHNGN